MPGTKNDRRYMEMAVEEMLKSRSEHTRKHDPLVGAVLVGPDGRVLGKAYRGGLRVGDHAEFTLIERQLGDRDLEGSTLFVTLEPCTAREPPKIACANRVISARIKRVVTGMVDPNPNIQGRGIILLQQHGVGVDFFDLDLVHQIWSENEGFIGQCQLAEEPFPEGEEWEGPSEKEKEPVSAASVDDFSPEMIMDYLGARQEKLAVASPGLWVFFHKNGFVTRDEKRETYVPTMAGLLLFGTKTGGFPGPEQGQSRGPQGRKDQGRGHRGTVARDARPNQGISRGVRSETHRHKGVQESRRTRLPLGSDPRSAHQRDRSSGLWGGSTSVPPSVRRPLRDQEPRITA